MIAAALFATLSSLAYAEKNNERRGPSPSFDVHGDGGLPEDELPEPLQKGERPN